MKQLAWRPQWVTRNGRNYGSISTAASPLALFPRIQGHVRGWIYGGKASIDRPLPPTSRDASWWSFRPPRRTCPHRAAFAALGSTWFMSDIPRKGSFTTWTAACARPMATKRDRPTVLATSCQRWPCRKHVRRLPTGRSCRGAKPVSEIPAANR